MTPNEQTTKSKRLWIGLGAALLFCLCAVVAAVLVFRQAGRQLSNGFKTDPGSAAEAAHQITDYDLPPGYQEQMAMDLIFYSLVIIGPEDNGPTTQPVIMLAQFNQQGMNRQQMEQQVRQSFEQQVGQRGADMQLVETKKMEIRGEEAEVSIYEGTDAKGYVMRQLLASFPGKDGTGMLMIMGSPSGWDDALVNDFIDSLR